MRFNWWGWNVNETHGGDDAPEYSLFLFSMLQLDWFFHFKIVKLWIFFLLFYSFQQRSKCQKPNIIQFFVQKKSFCENEEKKELNVFLKLKSIEILYRIDNVYTSCERFKWMPRKIHTTDYYLLCFDVCFFILYIRSHPFSFRLLSHWQAQTQNRIRTNTHTHIQFKMNGFKMTKNSERTHIQTRTSRTALNVHSIKPPSDKHRMMNTLGAVRTFLFDLIQFIRGFFHS